MKDSGLILHQNTAAELRAKAEDERTFAAFQYLMKRAYFSCMDNSRRDMRYALIRALARDMLNRNVEFEVYT